MDDIATRAADKIGGTGRLAGIDKHTYAKDLLLRYQSMFGKYGAGQGLVVEKSWVNGVLKPYGTKGSVRLDVYDLNTGDVWDYKFGTTPMSAAQRQKIMTHAPMVNSITPVVRP